MVHPGHLWAAELSTEQRSAIRRLLAQRGLQLTALNMPNIDINVAAAAPEMRAYSLNLLSETVRLAGELGARGVVIGPGKANPLFPADASELIGHFFAALDRLCPVAEKSGTALWVENMPFAFLPAIGPLMDALTRYGNDAVRVVYDVANAYFIGEDFADGLQKCRTRLALVHLSDTGRQVYRHDPVDLGTVPFAGVQFRPTVRSIPLHSSGQRNPLAVASCVQGEQYFLQHLKIGVEIVRVMIDAGVEAQF
ncbi:MAG: sugar phosphate isomerase/epimerase family protein, partial [Steroidobacteraceae bacterium]